MLNWVLLLLFVWGVADVLSGLRLLLLRVPLLLLGRVLAKPPKIGYTKEQLERMFAERKPGPKSGELDENGVPYL